MTDVIIEKLEGQSLDIAEDRIARLREDFPEVFRDGKIDFDTLKRALGEWIEPENERFGLQWPGKAAAFQAVQTPSVATLLPDPDNSVDWDTTQNLIIEGDNLEVLKLLQKSYYGKVKMIYIDPPYNTGNDFIYPDNYREGLQSYLEFTGQVNAEGKKLTTNTESGGRYHSNWLNMVYPRLYLARNLLRDDGVIFVSIDDNELQHLISLLEDVFGGDNTAAVFIWEKRTSRENRKVFSVNHDYIVAFARDIAIFSEVRNPLPLTDEAKQRYSNPDNDPRGPWQSVAVTAQAGHGTKSQFYTIVTPSGRSIDPPAGNCWRFTQQRLDELIADNRIWFGSEGNNVPRQKAFLAESDQGLTPHTLWKSSEVGTTDSAKRSLIQLMGGTDTFDTVKPTMLIQRMLEISTNPGDLVLDFFAGSGSTGHAVMQQNAEDGGNRRYILVQLPESIDPPKTLDDGMKLSTIADITRERVRRAGKKIGADHSNVDTGFRAYKLATSNFTPWDGTPPDAKQGKLDLALPETAKKIARQLEAFTENVVPDRTQEDLLTEITLRLGYDLTVPVERLAISGHTVFSIDNGAILACLEPSLTLDLFEEMAQRDPGQIVCLDSAFGDVDELKVNAVQVIRSRARSEEATIKLWLV